MLGAMFLRRLPLGCLYLLGCQTAAPAPAEYPPMPQQTTAAEVTAEVAAPEESPAPTAPTAPTAALPQLTGVWAQYWSLEGQVDTARHLFLSDGRWSWLVPAGTANGPTRTRGKWSVEGQTLFLEATQFEKRDETGAWIPDPEGAATRTPHELGPCPPNEEAKALDGKYACVRIDGQIFWRRATPAEVDQAPFFE